MSRASLVVLIALFVITRAGGAWLADHPGTYRGDTYITGDVTLYHGWAQAIARGGAPYSDVAVQYPPGVLPFILAPELGSPPDAGYRERLIVLLATIDAAGLAGLLVLARRGGSAAGPWLWVTAIPLLGPIAYTRLDLVPAVATIWALERAARHRWYAAGGWLGYAAMAKLYPALLIPAGAALARRRAGSFLAGAALVGTLAIVPVGASLSAVYRDVIGYHSARGVQAESSWGLGLLWARHAGYPARVDYSFGSFNVSSAVSPALKAGGDVLSVAIVLAGLAAAVLAARRGAETFAWISYGTIVMAMVTGNVLSPQYLLWAIALGAAASCAPLGASPAPFLLLPAAALSQEVYPFFYDRLLAGDTVQLTLLSARNLLLLASGLWALVAVVRARPSEHPVPADEQQGREAEPGGGGSDDQIVSTVALGKGVERPEKREHDGEEPGQ